MDARTQFRFDNGKTRNEQQGAAKNAPNENCNFSELARYFITKFCTIIFKGCLHYYYTFYEIMLIFIEMAGS